MKVHPYKIKKQKLSSGQPIFVHQWQVSLFRNFIFNLIINITERICTQTMHICRLATWGLANQTQVAIAASPNINIHKITAYDTKHKQRTFTDWLSGLTSSVPSLRVSWDPQYLPEIHHLMAYVSHHGLPSLICVHAQLNYLTGVFE